MMSDNNLSLQLHRTVRRFNGSTLEWDMQPYHATVDAIREEQRRYTILTDDELTAVAGTFRDEIRSGENPDSLLVPVFAVVAEVIHRLLRHAPFDEQLICGVILHRGKLAQMQTGEGKTLAAVFPAVLNALGGNGVHVLTFNDYLARRDAQWMGPVYRQLGLSVGYVQEGMSLAERHAAYHGDITYLTAKEAGFDFLRDNCSYDTLHVVQRDFHYAIVDEADSLLIDEARIPMVIAAATKESDGSLASYTSISRQMQPDRHYTFDQYGRKICLTDEGIDFAEKQLGAESLFSEYSDGALSRLYHALHAEYLLHRSVDYLIRDDRVQLIDELTGRIAENRRWPEGLHAAVEAKEGCAVQPRGTVRSSITMHHFLALYPKIAAMTATAERAEEEFRDWYRLTTVIVPPHRLCIRKDHADRVFLARHDKNMAIIEDIAKNHATGRPILVGTRTVRDSEELAAELDARGICHRVLNAGNNTFEASIIAEAGTFGAVTIATNMAGRGTDIRLGGADGRDHARIAALGGLYVIGTNRFESRRIDDQLRGRAGRQGDPGASRFFISLDDDLFVKYRINELLPKRYLTTTGNGSIVSSYVNNEVDRLQRIIEGQNGDIKETLGKYAILPEKQRTIFASHRRAVLSSATVPEALRSCVENRTDLLPDESFRHRSGLLCRRVLLSELDRAWSSYLSDMADLRDGIHFRRYGNQDPLQVFNALAIERFELVIPEAEATAVKIITAIISDEARHHLNGSVQNNHPSATWTYLVSDNPFEDNPDLQMNFNAGYSVFAGLLWPFTVLLLMLKRRKREALR